MPFRYTAFGLLIESDMPLPELVPAAFEDAACDLNIERAPLDAYFDRKGGPARALEEQVLFFWEQICRFAMLNGNVMLYEPEPDASDDAVRLIMLGMCMGILLHQRGCIVLHGSAVDIGGRAVAFMGIKGTGKSTMVSGLVCKGHRLISDDLVVLRPRGSQHIVSPGHPSVKLWPETAEMLGLDVDAMPQLHETVTKRWFDVGDRFQPDPMPLAAMVMLEDGPGPVFERIVRGKALMRVVAHTYALRIMGHRGANAHYFQASLQCVRNVPVYSLARPKDAAGLMDLIKYVESWTADLPEGIASGSALV